MAIVIFDTRQTICLVILLHVVRANAYGPRVKRILGGLMPLGHAQKPPRRRMRGCLSQKYMTSLNSNKCTTTSVASGISLQLNRSSGWFRCERSQVRTSVWPRHLCSGYNCLICVNSWRHSDDLRLRYVIGHTFTPTHTVPTGLV